jgi:OmpA-OmpF porin, OOP family
MNKKNAMYSLKILLLLSVFTLGSAFDADANDYSSFYPKGNRFSISLYGGMTLPQEGSVWSTFKGNFETKVGYAPAYGGGILYSPSQPFALELSIISGYFEADDEATRPFRNDYLHYSGRVIVYLNNIFHTWRLTDRLNPYLFGGLGQMDIDLTEMITADHKESVTTAMAGVGLTVRITNLFDIFANYQFTIADTDLIDGRASGHPRDMWGTVLFGITTNLGSPSKKHIRWEPRDRIVDDHLMSQSNRLAALENAWADMQKRMEDQQEEYRRLFGRIDALDAELRALAARIDELPEETVIRFDSNVLFSLNSHTLSDQAKAVLDHLIESLGNHPEVRVHLVGHTDSIGPAEYNLELSKIRATAVADYLIESGVAAERITVEGRGQNEPAASNETEAGRRLNRRVVIDLK